MTMSLQRSSKLVFVCVLLFLASACDAIPDEQVETRRSAVSSSPEYAMVPAYYNDNDSTSWTTVGGLHSGSIVITGPNSGPPSSWDQTLANYAFPFEQNAAVMVFGYVDNSYGRSATQLANDVSTWSSYTPDGIFFDVSQRLPNQATDQDLARAEYLLQLVFRTANFSYWKGGNNVVVAFNWGVPYPYMGKRYVDCLSWAMVNVQPARGGAYYIGVRETTEATYMNEDASWNGTNSDHWEWVNQYYGFGFFHLVYSYRGAYSIQAIAQKAADRYAYNFFVTSFDYPTQWNQAPSPTLMNAQGQPPTVTHPDPGAWSFIGNCPTPALCSPGLPGC